MNLFLEKTTNKFLCTYWPLSFCKIFKKFLGLIQSYEDVPFLGPKWSICHEQNFFVTNHYYYFHLPIGPFYCAKFKKILTADPELWGYLIFGPKMVHLPQIFWGKIINIIPIYLLAPFIVQNLKKNSSSRPRVMRMRYFWAQNGPFPQMRIFSENMLMSLLSLIHAYLHTKNQSQILIY